MSVLSCCVCCSFAGLGHHARTALNLDAAYSPSSIIPFSHWQKHPSGFCLLSEWIQSAFIQKLNDHAVVTGLSAPAPNRSHGNTTPGWTC